jgi:hypothetical protein
MGNFPQRGERDPQQCRWGDCVQIGRSMGLIQATSIPVTHASSSITTRDDKPYISIKYLTKHGKPQHNAVLFRLRHLTSGKRTSLSIAGPVSGWWPEAKSQWRMTSRDSKPPFLVQVGRRSETGGIAWEGQRDAGSEGRSFRFDFTCLNEQSVNETQIETKHEARGTYRPGGMHHGTAELPQ